MKNFKLFVPLIALLLIVAACGKNNADSGASSPAASSPAASAASPSAAEPVTIKVGATPVPHAEILNSLKDKLKAEGVILEVVEFTDYIQPNVQVYEKQLDANFFQHVPYLDSFNKEKGYDLVKVAGVHIEPIGAYSKKITKAADLKDGAKVAIPNDATNGGRALSLLA
jgi:D-methionine transport system substrate-binding protein